MNVRAARLLTKALAGVCGVLTLCALVQYAGYGRGYGWLPDEEGDGSHLQVGAIDSQPVRLPPASAFASIEAHPLFNDDRQPAPVSEGVSEESVPPPSPLNVALTGVILDASHDVRVAMVQDKARNQPVALRVGMPLEGDQASWTLVEVKPRAAVFRSAANETTEIELETSVAQSSSPRGPVKPAPAGNKASPGTPGKDATPANSDRANPDASADLARRIEERRRQMREDAERLRNGGPSAPSKK